MGPSLNPCIVFAATLLSFNLIGISNSKLVLNEEEKQAIEKFRPLAAKIAIHGYQTTDSYLHRWLKVSNLNVKEALQKFKEAQKWRQDNKIDSILDESYPEFKAAFPYTSDGVDYEGRTVLTASAGNFDLRRVIIAGKADQFLRFVLMETERAARGAAEAVYRSNATDTRIVSLTDLQGFSLRKIGCLACVQVQSKITRLVYTYYPGLAAETITINTPRVSLPMYNLLLGFLPSEIRDRFKFFGSNRTEWSAYISKIIPPDQITFQFGGTKSI